MRVAPYINTFPQVEKYNKNTEKQRFNTIFYGKNAQKNRPPLTTVSFGCQFSLQRLLFRYLCSPPCHHRFEFLIQEVDNSLLVGHFFTQQLDNFITIRRRSLVHHGR